jgi:hypothetical protein
MVEGFKTELEETIGRKKAVERLVGGNQLKTVTQWLRF